MISSGNIGAPCPPLSSLLLLLLLLFSSFSSFCYWFFFFLLLFLFFSSLSVCRFPDSSSFSPHLSVTRRKDPKMRVCNLQGIPASHTRVPLPYFPAATPPETPPKSSLVSPLSPPPEKFFNFSSTLLYFILSLSPSYPVSVTVRCVLGLFSTIEKKREKRGRENCFVCI